MSNVGEERHELRTHIRGIYRKLRVHSARAAVKRALEDGLI